MSPVAVTRSRSDYPQTVDSVIERCLQKDPRRRLREAGPVPRLEIAGEVLETDATHVMAAALFREGLGLDVESAGNMPRGERLD